ncbi:hypothetical protein D7M15_05830 [Streptomyces sp. Z26]|nr:hypothetical protein D7M15_05830 [Streptomyces sp. Z26]
MCEETKTGAQSGTASTAGVGGVSADPYGGVAATDWERRVAAVWAALDRTVEARGEAGFRAAVDALAAELPPGSALADFERACAYDSTGHSDRAVPLYRSALATGLTGLRRRRAVIQLSSSLRNVGGATESVRLLRAELAVPYDELDEPARALDDAVRAVLALALTDTGREREAVSLVLGALARHLPRYQRSMAAYARLLVEPESTEPRPADAEPGQPRPADPEPAEPRPAVRPAPGP